MTPKGETTITIVIAARWWGRGRASAAAITRRGIALTNPIAQRVETAVTHIVHALERAKAKIEFETSGHMVAHERHEFGAS